MLPPFFRLLFFLWGRRAGSAAPSGPTNGILLEDGSSFLLAESGNYLVQE